MSGPTSYEWKPLPEGFKKDDLESVIEEFSPTQILSLVAYLKGLVGESDFVAAVNYVRRFT